jgi:hypothetical protein
LRQRRLRHGFTFTYAWSYLVQAKGELDRALLHELRDYLPADLLRLLPGEEPAQPSEAQTAPIPAHPGEDGPRVVLRGVEEGPMVPGDADRRQPPAAEMPTTWPKLLCASDLARLLKQPIGRVETFLRRFRDTQPDCFEHVETPRKNEPRYLYRTPVVWPALQQQLSLWQRLTDG